MWFNQLLTGLHAPSKGVQPLSGLDHLLSCPLPFPECRRCSPIPIGVYGFPLLFMVFSQMFINSWRTKGKLGKAGVVQVDVFLRFITIEGLACRLWCCT